MYNVEKLKVPYPTHDSIVLCQMGLAVFAHEYLFGGQVGVVSDTHGGCVMRLSADKG